MRGEQQENNRKFQFEFIVNKKGVKVWWALETMNRFNGPVSFMSSGTTACSATRVRAEKCTESSLLALWGKKRREIVVVEFMGDGWRGSEKVLNQEEQINAMLSRPFYQPFNIIGFSRSSSRVRRSDNFGSGPYNVGPLSFVAGALSLCLPLMTIAPLYVQRATFILLPLFYYLYYLFLVGLSAKESKLRAKFCEDWEFSDPMKAMSRS